MGHETKLRVLVVADDLTGSLDTAGPFAQRGLRTLVLPQPLGTEASTTGNAQVVAVNTETRQIGPQASVDRVEQCLRRFAGQQFDIVFKKIDSTMRGNVVQETLATMRACGRDLVLVAPAFPAQGRTVVNGIVHVDDVPLEKTGFARDALSPPPLQPLTDLFANHVGTRNVVHWRSGHRNDVPDKGVVVADAGSVQDMSETFTRIRDSLGKTLLVGSAGLGQMLAKEMSRKENSENTPQGQRAVAGELPTTDGPIVIVVGSRATQSSEQVDSLRGRNEFVVLNAPSGLLAARPNLQGVGQIVVRAVERKGVAADSGEVARSIAQLGLSFVENTGAGAIVVTGGDTAMAVLTAASCSIVEVGGELMPGIAFSRFEHKGRTVLLVTKAGGFGKANTLLEIVRCLRGKQRVE